jgi:hypothetical protein
VCADHPGMRVDGAHGYRLTSTGGHLTDVELAEALRQKVAEDKLAIEIRTDPRSVYAGALGAALWAAFRHRVLEQRSAGVPPAGSAASRRGREVAL